MRTTLSNEALARSFESGEKLGVQTVRLVTVGTTVRAEVEALAASAAPAPRSSPAPMQGSSDSETVAFKTSPRPLASVSSSRFLTNSSERILVLKSYPILKTRILVKSGIYSL